MRYKLIKALTMGWRYAENLYLEHNNDIFKTAIENIQKECHLTIQEQEELESDCNSLGI